MPYKVGVSFNQEGDFFFLKKILTISFEMLTTYSPLEVSLVGNVLANWSTHTSW